MATSITEHSVRQVVAAALLLTLMPSLFLLGTGGAAWSGGAEDKAPPDRYGLTVIGGSTYAPRNDISLFMVSGFALFDYEKVWRHKAPDPLRFKVECIVGTAAGSEHGLIGSGGVLALYYIDRLSKGSFRPYFEAGIGAVYTDFRLKGQGLRVSFNPQMGAGFEFGDTSSPLFTAVRLHHISNGGLHHDNRGINSVVVMMGRFLK